MRLPLCLRTKNGKYLRDLLEINPLPADAYQQLKERLLCLYESESDKMSRIAPLFKILLLEASSCHNKAPKDQGRGWKNPRKRKYPEAGGQKQPYAIIFLCANPYLNVFMHES